MEKKITVIKGDGIGPEIVTADHKDISINKLMTELFSNLVDDLLCFCYNKDLCLQ